VSISLVVRIMSRFVYNTCGIIYKKKCILVHIILQGIYTTDLDPALVGLSMAYAVDLTGLVQYTMRISAEVEDLVMLL